MFTVHLGSPYGFFGFSRAEFLHGGVVLALTRRQKHIDDSAFVLLLQHVEVVDDDADEKVESKEGPENDEGQKEEVIVLGILESGLFIHARSIGRVAHDLHPTLESRHLKNPSINLKICTLH